MERTKKHIRHKDLTGERFGRLVVVNRIGSTQNDKSLFLCQCDCGNQVNVIGGNLTSGTTSSCGCYKSEKAKAKANPQRRRLKVTYRNMIMRCHDETNKSYPRYGGRGITVCDEWKADFTSFYEWAMRNGYSDSLTLDRKDGTKGYSPDNCRWATYTEQANNTKRNHIVEYNGEKMTLAMFARLIGIGDSRARYLLKHGYSTEQIKERIERT